MKPEDKLPPLKFTHLMLEDGLPHHRVRGILQDSQGFMWFGTDGGLVRYDGYECKTYRYDNRDDRSLSHNVIWVMMEDRAGTLWIGTNGNGLNRYNRETDDFTRYRHNPNDPTSLSDNLIRALYEDDDGTLWVGTKNGGLSRFDRATGTFLTYRYDPANPNSLSNNSVYAVYEEPETGLFWLGTLHDGIILFDRETGRFIRFSHGSDSLSNESVNHIGQDRHGHIWIATQDGLYRFDPQSEILRCYQHDPQNPASLAHNWVTHIKEDRTGRLWFATFHGLDLYDRQTDSFIHYQENLTAPDGFYGVEVFSIYEDRTGAIWIGGANGINRIAGESEKFTAYRHNPFDPNSLGHNQVNAILVDSTNTIWIGTRNGLDRFDGETFTHYRYDPHTADSLSNNIVDAIVEDPQGNLWICTNNGLNRFDGEAFMSYLPNPDDPDSLAGQPLTALSLDRSGKLWIGIGDFGLDRFDPETETFTHYPYDKTRPFTSPGSYPHRIVQDRTGGIWVGADDGFSHLDPATETFTRYLPNPDQPGSMENIIFAICPVSDGTVWVGGYVGLLGFDSATETFTRHYTEKDGLAGLDIISILEDEQGDLWIGTRSSGLSRFDPHTETFHNYDVHDGLHSELFVGHAAAATSDGRIILGGAEGFTIFNPTHLTGNPHIPPVVLTDFLLFNKPVPIGGDSLLQQAIWATDTITLSPKDYVFSIEFAALNYSIPQKNRYKYKLEGFDPDWNEVDSTHRSATYTNLPGGEYTFRVLGSNNDGVWNEEGISLKITVQPPLWEKIRLEKEAAEAANRAKSVFLAQMSHELRTPLNAILGYVHIIRQQKPDDALARHLSIISQSSEHLLALINDILDLARIESGKTALYPSAIHLPAFLETLISIIQARVVPKEIALLYEFAPNLPVGVLADATRLRQVLLNLLSNAVKFTEQGEVTFRVQVLNRSEGGMGEEPPASHIQLRFEVSDTGIGMTPEELEKAFQPFEQTADGVQASEGAGLGLPICRQLVQLMGGELQAESQPGEGSRFWFALTLPLTTAAETGATPPAQMITGYKGETRKVLVVDDNATNRAVLVDMLTPLGFEVHEAEGGRAALEQAQIARPHLILMDRFMPEMDGLAATQQLRQIPALGDLPVVSVSASVMEEDQQQALEAGHDAFLPKPVRWPQLAAILQEYLQLEWVYAEGSDESVVEGELTPPPTEELELLQELAAGGDIFALRQRAAHIEALGEQYIPFARRLHDLAADYKLLEITKFLKQFLDDEGQAQ